MTTDELARRAALQVQRQRGYITRHCWCLSMRLTLGSTVEHEEQLIAELASLNASAGTPMQQKQAYQWPSPESVLSVRVHDCPDCGLVLDRDVNAALNIQGLGHSLRGGMIDGSP